VLGAEKERFAARHEVNMTVLRRKRTMPNVTGLVEN
jgi:hypothetical protein